MLEIYIVRHGQTEDNAKRIIAGQLPGKLTDLGRKQAFYTGRHLATVKFTHAYVSDLQRTKDTFEEISKSLQDVGKIDVTYDPSLREKHGGVLHGLSLDLPKKLAAEKNLNIREFRPDEGESWEDVNVRAGKFIERLTNIFLKKKDKLEKGMEKLNVIGKSEIEKKEEASDNVEEEEETKADELKEKKENLDGKKIEDKPINEKRDSKLLQKKAIFEKPKDLKQDLALKPKKMILEEKNEKDPGLCARVIVVTHGGFIMELYNYINLRFFDMEPAFKNDSTNCSIHILQIFCKKTQGKCKDVCSDDSCITIKIIKKNSDTHLKILKDQYK